MRVLIAEEDVITLTFLLRVLLSLGHQVEAVRDGLAAWKSLQKSNTPSLAILNGMLPGKSGLDIAMELRALPTSHYTYILLLGPSSEKCEVIEALEAGADGLLALPVSAAELGVHLKAAERVLERENRLHQEIANLRETLRAHMVQSSARPQGEAAASTETSAPAAIPEAVPDVILNTLEVPEHVANFANAETGKPGEVPTALASGVGSIVPRARMQACFSDMLQRIRYIAPTRDNTATKDPDFTVYSALALEEQCLWLDLKIEMGRPPAAT